MTHRCKLIATLGPGCDDPEVCRAMIESGVNLARLNMSHGSPEMHERRLRQFRKQSELLNIKTGVILDLQGPKIRIGGFKNGVVELKQGQSFSLSLNLPVNEGDASQVAIFDRFLLDDLKPNQILCLDDGRIELEVDSVQDDVILTKVLVGGHLSNRKGLNVRGGGLSASSVTQDDLEHLALGLSWGIDFVAVSFVKSPDDIHMIRRHLVDHDDVGVIAKIECYEAVECLKDMIDVSDGIMVARGDLAIEIGDARVPVVQKEAIRLARDGYKPVIVATQMLDSMVDNPIPTRAETSDVANAVMDGADAVMMSAETAVGKYPKAVVEMAVKIIREVEAHLSHLTPSQSKKIHFDEADESIAMAAMYIANRFPVAGIIALTESGDTPLRLSRIRTDIPILGISERITTVGKMCLYRGVSPYLVRVLDDKKKQMSREVVQALKARGIIKEGDTVLVTKGDQLGKKGGTNTLKIVTVPKEF